MKKRMCAFCLALALSVPVFAFAAETVPDAGNGCAPVAQNLELETYRGVAVGGKLEAADPDGDLCGFEITTPPVKGTVTLAEDGSFVYTPVEGKRGRDYFGYRAADAQGNVSQEATVIIRLKKQERADCYADMASNGAHYAALRLKEAGVFCGKTVAGEALFEPEAAVSRADFLAMSMRIADSALLSGVTRTGFADDEAIAVWAKPCVATALMDGVVAGYSVSGGAEFRPDDAITGYEAAVLLDRLLNITDVSVSAQDDAVPVWAAQSNANLRACRLLPAGAAETQTLTRAQCAQMLLAAMEFLEKR